MQDYGAGLRCPVQNPTSFLTIPRCLRPLPFLDCPRPGSPACQIAAKRPPDSIAPPELAPLLLLLNDACMNDGNLKQLPALRVLPPVVSALDAGTAGEGAAAAAVTLLCTAVTSEDVRREVSKLLAAGDGLARLVGLLAAAQPVVQVRPRGALPRR